MEFQINTNQVILAQINQVESGEYNVTECRFNFSSEYEGLTKIAVFTGANGDAYKITILNNKCEIPSELLTESQIVQIGVYAYEVQGKEFILRYSPMPTRFMIEKGSYVVNAVNMSRPTPTEVEQLQSQITHNANDIEDLQQTVSEHTTDISNIQSDINDIKAEQTEQNTNIQKNTDDIVNINQAIDTINTDITDIDSAIGDINEDIDNLEQDLTNYSLITETGSQINLNVNSTNYQITAILKDKNGNVIYTSNAIDLPIESMIVNARYDNQTKEIVLTLQNGNTLRISVADLVSGLVSETQLQTILANYYNKTEIDNLLSNLAERVSTNEEDIADIKEEQTTQNTNIEELQNQVETLQEDLESANSEIEELNTDITNMAKAMYKVDGQGSDITLENTSENKLVEFGLEGRTEQEQLSGKNLLNIADLDETVQGLRFRGNEKNELIISGTYIGSTDYVTFNYKNINLPADTYTFTADSNNHPSGINLRLWTRPTNLNLLDGANGTTSEALTAFTFALIGVSNNTEYNITYKIQLEKGSSKTSFEPYCGGIPAPNPDFPQQIKNVTGNANVKIQNKNLNSGLRLGYYNQNTGEYTENNNYSCSINPILVTENTTYIFSENGEIVDAYVYEFDINGNYLGRKRIINTGIYTPTSDVAYFNYTFKDGRLENVPLNIKAQIEKGSIATSYVPHQEQNYPFTFAEGQRGMQGTTLEDDGIHQKRKQIVLTGEENWGLSGITTNNQYYLDIDDIKQIGSGTTQANLLCNYLKYISGYIGYRNNNVNGISGWDSQQIRISLDINIVNRNVPEFKQWLATKYANGTPVIVEYELAESELENNIIPYNETQQAQYDEIKEATSYDDITYISSESDELGFNMNVVAVADANKVIDNQNSEIDTIKSRLDLLEG